MSKEVRKTQINFISRLFDGSLSIDEPIFINIHSLRLSKHGCNLLKLQYEFWEFDSPGTTAGNIIALNKVMKFPYYIDKKQLVLFTERDAFIARLGGPENWLKGKSN